MFLIHRLTLEFYANEGREIGSWRLYSFLVMLLGWLSAIGGSLVANFQEGPQLATHNTGAFIFFIGITLYFWGQLLMAYSLKPGLSPIHLTNVRLLLTFTITGLVIFHMVCLFAEPFVGKDANGNTPVKPTFPNNIERYNSSSPFYSNHLASTTSEWILALMIEFVILTFCYDFSWTVLHAPKMEQLELPDEEKTNETDLRSRFETSSRAIDAYDYGNSSLLHLPVSQPAYIATSAYGTYSRQPRDYSSTLERSNPGLPRVDRIHPGMPTIYRSYFKRHS
ncbi:hypothetical protein WR25_00165 isoform I [Diploscapter pachys]|nr:hypothetical protein WR25_00165 isoform C [Diploscapter pachys]PAV62542.1 hypothetical protein WR25_00165 isoform D [Diploscapter pachys]PAV62543.1 hypothetical protein WR25_00165 isoform E [Diploscapter pachys]PAV62544.1 hypothetical protein WR25_00165 isoform F [Diploscapter pachys]PAV62545.1 hypothetical protein WR25_00165 isoform G [Diploscapter pachys]